MSDMSPVAAQVCDEKMKRLEDRIDKVEIVSNEIHTLAMAVERLTLTVKNMVTEQEMQRGRIVAIESKDAEMWRTMIRYIATGIVGAVLGYVLKNIGF